MHVCQRGSKAPVKSKNAQSASQLPLGENQMQAGLGKNPAAIWEVNRHHACTHITERDRVSETDQERALTY